MADHNNQASTTTKQSIVFLGVNVNLFKSCFFEPIKEDPMPSRAWDAFELVVLEEDPTTTVSRLSEALFANPNNNVVSVVFQSTDIAESLLDILVRFYNSGGLVVFFGIYGEFGDPDVLSSCFSLPEPWRFSAYTSEKYELTSQAHRSLGYAVTQQEYTKANLLSVPFRDRWMVELPMSLHAYLSSEADYDPSEPEYKEEEPAIKEAYLVYCERCHHHCPLAVHQNKNGGKLAYLGFVNGNDNIPRIVRALVTQKKIPSYSMMKGWY